MREQVKISPPESSEPITLVAEDKLLERLHRCTAPNANCSPEDEKRLHADLECCEVFEMYNAYTQGRVPTLPLLKESIEHLIQKIPDSLRDDPEAAAVIKYLQGRHQSISHDVRTYVGLVIRFVTLEQSTLRFRDYEKYLEQIKDIDVRRRQMHDNLLASLNTLRTKIEEAYDLGVCEKDDCYIWSPGSTSEIPSHVVPVFSPTAINNRDLIKNWALAADFAEHFDKLSQLLSEKK